MDIFVSPGILKLIGKHLPEKQDIAANLLSALGGSEIVEDPNKVTFFYSGLAETFIVRYYMPDIKKFRSYIFNSRDVILDWSMEVRNRTIKFTFEVKLPLPKYSEEAKTFQAALNEGLEKIKSRFNLNDIVIISPEEIKLTSLGGNSYLLFLKGEMPEGQQELLFTSRL